MPKIIKNGLIIALLVGMALALLFAYRQSPSQEPEQVQLSVVMAEIQQGKVKSISVPMGGGTAQIDLVDKKQQEAVLTDQSAEGVRKAVDDYNATGKTQIVFGYSKPDQAGPIIGNILLTLLPIVLIGGFFIFMIRGAQGANNQAINFGQSRAKLIAADRPKVTFDDVAGCDEAKEELREVVGFLKEPDEFRSVGARIPRGVLLVGPPGCGKTLLAKAVAGEAGAAFYSVSGSEFVEMFVGVGAARVRDLFEKAKRSAPAILFIDEIDAVGRSRGAGIGGSHDEREQTLNQILVEMDGFDTRDNVIVIAATNRPDILDPALVRDGRFDRRVVIDPPDIRGRELIFGIHVRGKPLDKDVVLVKLARATPGFSGANIANAVNEASIIAVRRKKERGGKKIITLKDFYDAIDKVSIGPERKSRVISKRVKRIVSYHEVGHALVMAKTPHSAPVRKVSNIVTGMALGYTMPIPDEDQSVMMSQAQVEAQIVGLMGGRVAEEVFLPSLPKDDPVGEDRSRTTGASNDLERATSLAHQMVTKWAMSDKLGPRIFDTRQGMVFLGKDMYEGDDYSDEIARQIDGEIDRILLEAHEKARKILEENRDLVNKIVGILLDKETLDQEEFSALVNGTYGSSSAK